MFCRGLGTYNVKILLLQLFSMSTISHHHPPQPRYPVKILEFSTSKLEWPKIAIKKAFCTLALKQRCIRIEFVKIFFRASMLADFEHVR